ncbi:methyltransferase family protein [Motilibacter rhizosphaerae]|uniref:Methyltransferase family protein n=1 Tax=Motilibacter rhizosphaerae TaxID=598652 RepID=A0A4Q7NXB8_9ACTN|nr:class I SAM-dependent methyltransferase [Motilibacter rhizosphaerae]RZS91558.1 methyltransferase family protein [Motilibacter rhizosphaerae]
MTQRQVDPVMDALAAWEQGAWCLASVVLLGRDPDSDEGRAARQVLEAAGVVPPGGELTTGLGASPAQVAAQAAAGLLQAAAVVQGADGWMALPDEVLLAQGVASGQMAAAFRRMLLPDLPGTAERLAAPGARMLDVGTGVGALATSFAAEFPALAVTGIDVSERVLALARQRLAELDVRDRVELRAQDVSTLAERAAYDLAWVPAPFVPPAALHEGVPRISRALRPGGVLLLAHGKHDQGTALERALTVLRTRVFGGTLLDADGAGKLLADAGLVDVRSVPTPPGAPGIAVARAAD